MSFNITKEEKITSTISFKDLIFYIERNGLKTLNTLIIAKLSRFAAIDIKIEITIVKSNLFQIS